MHRNTLGAALLTLMQTGALAQPAVTEGAQTYAANCAECHGENMVSGGAIIDIKQLGPNEKNRYLNIMREGKGQMPSYVGTLSDEQIENLWAYVRSKADK